MANTIHYRPCVSCDGHGTIVAEDPHGRLDRVHLKKCLRCDGTGLMECIDSQFLESDDLDLDELVAYWPEAKAELDRLRAERDKLRGAGIVVLGAWDMICDSHGWDADHMIEVKKARALLSRTEGGHE